MSEASDVAAFLLGLRHAVRSGRVVVSRYAIDRAIEDLGWLREDILTQLLELVPADFHRREVSAHGEGAWIWVFSPEVEGHLLWIRVTKRENYIVISFHEA
jgi:hypothetical protein